MRHNNADITQNMIDQASRLREDAVSALLEQSYTEVYCTIKAMVRDENVTRDLIRETYVTGIQGLRMLRDPAQFPDWIRMVAHTGTITYLAGRTPTLFSRMLIDHEEVPDFEDEYPASLPVIDMEQRVAETLLLDLMRTLPEDQRVCVVMYYYERRTIVEIAQELGISQDTVRSRLNYSKWKIKARVREWERSDVNLYGFKTRYAISLMVFLFQKYEEIIAKKPVPQSMLQGIMSDLGQTPLAGRTDLPGADDASARQEAEKQARLRKKAAANRRRRIGIAAVLTVLVVLLIAAVSMLAVRAHRLQKQISAGQAATGVEQAGGAEGGADGTGAGGAESTSGAGSVSDAEDIAAFDPGTTYQLPDKKFIAGIYSAKENMGWMEITEKEDEEDTYEVTFHGKTAKNKDFEETYDAKSDGNQLIVDSGTDAGTAATLRWVNEYTVTVNQSNYFETEKKVTVSGVYMNAEAPMRGGSGIDAYLGVWNAIDDSAVEVTMQMSAGALRMLLTEGGETKIDHTYASFQVEQEVNGLPSKLRAHQDGKEDETFWLYPDGTITFHSEDSEYSGRNFKQNM